MNFGAIKAHLGKAAVRSGQLASSPGARLAATIILGVAVAAVGGAWAVHYARYAVLDPLEATVFFAARRALCGDVPVADVPFAGMPFLPYWVGGAGVLFDFDLFIFRLVNAGEAFLGIALLFEAWRRRGVSPLVLLAGAFAVTASPWFWAPVVTRAGAAAATLALGAGAAVVIWPGWRSRRAFAVGVACAVAVGVHAQALPAALLLAAGAILKEGGLRSRLVAAASAAAILGLGIVGVSAFGFEEVSFFNWVLLTASKDTSIGLVRAVELWRMSPAAILTASATAFAVGRLFKDSARFELGMWALSMAAVVVPIFPAAAHGYDGVFALPLFALSSFAACARSFRAIPSEKRPTKAPLFARIVWLLPAIALLYPLPQTLEDETLGEELDELSALISKAAPDAEQLMSPAPSLAAWFHLDIVPGTELGLFSVGGSAELAKSFGFTTYRELARGVSEKKADVVVLMAGARRWNFRLVLPTFEEAPAKTYREFRKALDRNYRDAGSTRSFTVFVPDI